MKVLVGTASWSDKSLVASKKFYPREASTPEARLRYYATQFPLVEVDTSYYAIPLAETAQAWADRTPGHFTLNMKAFRLFTGHATSAKVLPPDLRAELPAMKKPMFYLKDVPRELQAALWVRFKEALEPLRAAGKLGMVHFQFAPWLIRNRDGLAHVAHCVEVMKDYTVSVEFRNKTWFDEAHLGADARLRARAQRRPHRRSTRRRAFTTACRRSGSRRTCSTRWCGCTAATTRPGTSRARPSPRSASTTTIPMRELEDIAARVERLAPETFTTHVVLNNNNQDQGQRNAATLVRILEQRHRARVPRLEPRVAQVQASEAAAKDIVAAEEWVG